MLCGFLPDFLSGGKVERDSMDRIEVLWREMS